MSLAELAIRRWQLASVLFLLIAALGLGAFFAIPRSVDPHFATRNALIVATLPGADARDMEETVAKPIEEVIAGLDGIDHVESTSRDGNAVIRAEFSWSGDPERYFNDLVREVSAIRGRLPPNLQSLDFRKVRTTDAAAVQVALVSDTASWRRLGRYARDVKEAFERDPAVRVSQIHGLVPPEVTVALRPDRLSELGIPPTAVADALRLGGVDLPAGTVTSGARSFDVKAGGAYRTLAEVAQVPVRTAQGTVVRVGDIADVRWAAAEPRLLAFHNGHRAVFITAVQKDDADSGALADRLKAEIARRNAMLPPDLHLALQFDQSRDIRLRMAELARDFAIALALVLLTLLPLGVRPALIVMVAIPFSLAVGLCGLWVAGYNLNQLSIAGFIISLGLLVDDSIVVTENIARHLREGKDRVAVAVEATREITPAVLGATGVLIFAFVPILFLPEGPGAYIRSMAWAIIFTIAASLLVSLSLIPFLASRILPRSSGPEGNVVLRRVTAAIERLYRPVLVAALARPRATVFGALALTCSAFFLIPVIGFALFPAADAAHFRVEIEADEGSSLPATAAIVRQVSRIMASEPAITVRAATAGGGNPQVYYNVRSDAQYASRGEVLGVTPRWEGEASNAMIRRLRKRLADIPGARIRVLLFENGSPVVAPVAFRVSGPELPVLERLSDRVERVLETVPGARDIANPLSAERVALDAHIDQGKAALLDVPTGAPRRALRLALAGEQVGSFRDEEGDAYPVAVRLPLHGTQPVSALADVYVPTRAGPPVAFREIANPRLITVPASISRYGQERSVTVTAQIADGALASRVSAAAERRLKAIPLPPGYRITLSGEAEKLNTVLQGFGSVILITLFGIVAILVAEFGRFRETLVVAGVIPLGTFGGIMALLVTGQPLGFTATVGFIALIGIEIKNSILLVDFTSQLRARGLPLREAIERAGEVRFLPVLLTSITAIGGLLPLALFGGSLYGTLAIVIIGGLISSTLLSRIVTPAMYLLVALAGERRRLARPGVDPMLAGEGARS